MQKIDDHRIFLAAPQPFFLVSLLPAKRGKSVADKTVRASREVRFDLMTLSNVEYHDVLFRFDDILHADGRTPDMDGLLGFHFPGARPTSINFRTREPRIW